MLRFYLIQPTLVQSVPISTIWNQDTCPGYDVLVCHLHLFARVIRACKTDVSECIVRACVRESAFMPMACTSSEVCVRVCVPVHAGQPKSIGETFAEVFRSIPYCVQQIRGPYIETHPAVVDAFRPPADRRLARP